LFRERGEFLEGDGERGCGREVDEDVVGGEGKGGLAEGAEGLAEEEEALAGGFSSVHMSPMPRLTHRVHGRSYVQT
jgi:hypothetical protein